jgi:single-strand DNA-binding protein
MVNRDTYDLPLTENWRNLVLNSVTLQGRLVADPELRHTTSGVAVATMRLAVERDFKDKQSGQRKADFINVIAWRNTAEFASRVLRKGELVIADGKLQVSTYQAKDGTNRYTTDVVADNIYFCEKRREKESEGFIPPGFTDISDEEDEECPF